MLQCSGSRDMNLTLRPDLTAADILIYASSRWRMEMNMSLYSFCRDDTPDDHFYGRQSERKEGELKRIVFMLSVIGTFLFAVTAQADCIQAERLTGTWAHPLSPSSRLIPPGTADTWLGRTRRRETMKFTGRKAWMVEPPGRRPKGSP